MECLDEGVLPCLDKNNKDDCDGYFFHAHPLEQLLKETLGREFLFHNGYMQKFGCFEKYYHI